MTHRRIYSKLGLFVVLCVATSVFAVADWPQFLGPDRTGVSSEKGLLKTWPEAGPKVLWSVPVGIGYAGPAIRDGEVFVLDRKDNKDVLRCLSLAKGEELWSYAYDAPGSVGHDGSRNPPTVDEKYVYSVGMMGDFLCIDRKTHKPIWQKNLLKDFNFQQPSQWWGLSQSPYLYKNLVIVSPQSADAYVVAFDRATGNVVWKSPGLGLPGYVSPFVTTLAGVEQVVAAGASNKPPVTTKGLVAGLSLKDGSILWQYDNWACYIPIPNPTVLPGDKLFITGGYKAGSAIIQIKKDGAGLKAEEVLKLDPKDCGSQIHQAILYKDNLYLNSNSNEVKSGMTCMTLDGKIKWNTAATAELPKFGLGNFIMADGMLIAMDGDSGILYLIDPNPDGFKELAHAKVLDGKEIWAPLALTDGKLVIRSKDTMKCLDLKTS